MLGLKRTLTLAQSRFLGDRLKLDAVEKTVKESPIQFLEEFVKDFKLNIPYNTAFITRNLFRHGEVSIVRFSFKCFEML